MPATFATIYQTLLVFSVGAVVFYFWERVASEPGTLRSLLNFLSWAGKGLALPLLVWFLLNSGWLGHLPVFVPAGIAGTPGGAAWIQALPDQLAASNSVIASAWGALSLLWLLAEAAPRIEPKADRNSVACFYALVSSPIAALLLWAAGAAASGFAVMTCTGMVLAGILTLGSTQPHTPQYSRAIAHLKFGKVPEAEEAILTELEHATEDYDGWMMLAEVYARNFHDLPLADQTIRDLCQQPDLNPAQVALALHRLADWHLELGQDPVAARSALTHISERFPESHFGFMARQRLRQLPASRQDLVDQNQRRPLRLPSLKDPLDSEPATPPAPSPDVMARVQRLVARLEASPGDTAVREELARVLANELGNTEQAIEQVELLLALPGQPETRMAEWLSLLAAWHLRHQADPAAARRCLERLVREFPRSPQAFTAQRHLNLLSPTTTPART